jgi:hypothetical protein
MNEDDVNLAESEDDASGSQKRQRSATGLKEMERQRRILDSGWVEHHNAEGVPYYQNTKTGILQWDMPDVFKNAEDEMGGQQWFWIEDNVEGLVYLCLHSTRFRQSLS